MLLLFQLLVAVVALVCAVHLHVTLVRQRSKGWSDILKQMKCVDGQLSRMSYGSIFSDGLECSCEEAWERMDGWRGVRAIFKNTGTLLEAIEYMESVCETKSSCQRRMKDLRVATTRVRLSLLRFCCLFLLDFTQRSSGAAHGDVLRAYISLVGHMSLAVNDYCPDLLNEFRYVVLQT